MAFIFSKTYRALRRGPATLTLKEELNRLQDIHRDEIVGVHLSPLSVRTC